MFRKTILALFVLSVVICCMGQTFQYSRGWTNGKRSNSHIHEDSLLPEIVEMDMQRKLEKCLISLQRMARTPFTARLQPPIPGNGRLPDRHQSNEIVDEFGGDQLNMMKMQARK